MATYNVLVPVDGSPFSERILPAICHLLPPQHYALVLFRVEAEPVATSGSHFIDLDGVFLPRHDMRAARPAMQDGVPLYQIEERRRAELEDELRNLASAFPGYEVKTEVCFGDPAEEIAHIVKAHNIDLIAMATHGHTGMRRLIMGSVAEEVLRNVAVPVMMVRPSEME